MITGVFATSNKRLSVTLADADTNTTLETDEFSGTSVSKTDTLTDVDISSVNNLSITLAVYLAAASSTGSNGTITITDITAE